MSTTIAVNLLYVPKHMAGGTTTYASNMVKALAERDEENELLYFTNQYSRKLVPPQVPQDRIEIIPVRSRIHRIFCEQWWLPILGRRKGCRAWLSPGYVVPILASGKHVVVVHDLLYRRFPGALSGQPYKRWYWKVAIPLSIWRSEFVLTSSHSSRLDIVSSFGLDEHKVRVTYLDCGDQFKSRNSSRRFSPRYVSSLPARYVLTVGALTEHKNLEGLFRSFSIAQQRFDLPHKLVLVGKVEPGFPGVESLAERHGMRESVIHLQDVEADDLPGLYTAAEAFITLSLFEGFGLTPLEAMACGTPVISSHCCSLPEVVGDGGILVDPQNYDEVAEAIHGVLTDAELRQRLVQKGFENLRRFSWSKAADLTLESVRLALSG